MTNFEWLKEINHKAGENIKTLYSSGNNTDIDKCIAFCNDFADWVACCGGIASYSLIKCAQIECINSIYLCVQGFYKEAISALRQCLEHTLFSIVLSTNDYRYRLWKAGQFDMTWAQLMDDQNGIFGIQFIRTYAPDIEEIRSVELIRISKNIYRECSEYIHGNYAKSHDISKLLTFSESKVKQFTEYFESVKYIICMALFIRYREVLDDPEHLRKLEPLITDNIGMLYEVQHLFGKGDPINE